MKSKTLSITTQSSRLPTSHNTNMIPIVIPVNVYPRRWPTVSDRTYITIKVALVEDRRAKIEVTTQMKARSTDVVEVSIPKETMAKSDSSP